MSVSKNFQKKIFLAKTFQDLFERERERERESSVKVLSFFLQLPCNLLQLTHFLKKKFFFFRTSLTKKRENDDGSVRIFLYIQNLHSYLFHTLNIHKLYRYLYSIYLVTHLFIHKCTQNGHMTHLLKHTLTQNDYTYSHSTHISSIRSIFSNCIDICTLYISSYSTHVHSQAITCALT